MLEEIGSYRRISDQLHTAAQPTVEQFKMLKQQGIEIIINLARADSPKAIANEAQVVQENEMHYLNIPVDFEKPDIADLKLFFNAMEQHSDKITMVHCACNKTRLWVGRSNCAQACACEPLPSLSKGER